MTIDRLIEPLAQRTLFLAHRNEKKGGLFWTARAVAYIVSSQVIRGARGRVVESVITELQNLAGNDEAERMTVKTGTPEAVTFDGRIHAYRTVVEMVREYVS